MYDNDAVEFHDEAAHFKELLCTYSSELPGANPDEPITYGYVKDMTSSLALPSTQRLENAGPGAAAHMSLHLN